jgi:hypothetical protein
MSTIAWREPGLARAIASILPQVDRLNVFLQGYATAPACLDDPRVVVVRDADAPESAALGASAKFHWLWRGEVADGYHFAVDDDLEYPPDYVSYCVHKIEEYGRRPIVGFHGAIYNPVVDSYFNDRALWKYDEECDSDRFVHMLGTGTTAHHTSAIRLSPADFPEPNSCDLFMGIAAQKQSVPMLCLARPAEYLKPLPLAFDKRSASAPKEYSRRMAALHKSIPEWRINPAPPRPVVRRACHVVVIVPCYREPVDEVAKTVESALAVPNVTDVIIVDDGAGQAELDALASDRVRVIHRAANGGPAAALDDGIRAAPTDSVICRLDVRDRFYPEAKARQIDTVLSGKCRASASPHFDPVKGAVHTPVEKWQTLIYSVSQFTQMSTVFERSVWQEIRIDTSFRWAEDWRFCMLTQHYIGWEMFPEVTCSAGMFPGGYTDRGGPNRDSDRKRVYQLGQVLGHPDKYAHMYNPEWCKRRGLTPLRRVSRSK